MAYWQDLNLKDIPIGGFKGLHENVSPSSRPLGVLSAMSNLRFDKGGALVTCPGFTIKGTAGTGIVNGIHVYRRLNGTIELLRHVGTALDRWDTGTSAWVNISNTIPNSLSESASLNDLLIIFTGTTRYRWNGTTLTSIATPPQGKYVAEAYEKLFSSGISGRENDLDWCDTALPESWTPSSSSQAGSATAGYNYVKHVGFDKVEGRVIVWTAQSVEALFGPETPNGPGLWAIRTVSRDGTPNGRTVQNVNGTWVWLTDDSFATWGSNGARTVYDEIKTSLALIDRANIANACAWVEQTGVYVCQCPKTGGGTVWFIYDPKSGWMTGTGYDTRASAEFEFSGVMTTLVGDASGNVYTVSGTTNNGTAISSSVDIGPSTLGDSFVNKEITEVAIVVSAATGATVSAKISADEGATWGTAKTITATTTLKHHIIPVPIGSTDTKESPTFTMRISTTGVVTIHDVQFTVYTSGT